MIEKYEFGQLRVGGKEYQHDVIIYSGEVRGIDRVDAHWWRKEGHRLDKADLNEVLKAKPGWQSCQLALPLKTQS